MHQAKQTPKPHYWQPVKYVINGGTATVIHYCVLTTLIAQGMKSAGWANMLAAVVGITASFLGSRYFVFRESMASSLVRQVTRFGALYASLALMHGGLLYVWSDVGKLDLRMGFLLATTIQVVLTFFGNKKLVFAE